MEVELEHKINIDALGVLRIEKESNLVVLDFEPIPKPLEDEFNVLIEKFELEHTNARGILFFVKNHPKLNVLLKTYNYCQKLGSPYQGLYLSVSDIEAMYKSNFSKLDNKEEKLKKEKERLLNDLQDRKQAYYLENAYQICKEKLEQKEVLAYSHRRVGWSTPKYQLNSDFSIELKTNFGYGSVSYFYVRLQFKGLDIIAFSDWILYQYAKCFEIVRYTRSFELSNESWLEVLNYSKNACNLSTTDELSFINKYVVQECESMVNGLEEILVGEEFKFLNWKRIYTDVHIEGHNLIEFRGEKISGALNFLDKILQFESVTKVSNFISRIESCNKQVQPMLVKEVPLIEQELDKLYEILKVLKPIHTALEQEKALLEKKKIEFKKLKIETKEFSLTSFNYIEFEKQFKALNPTYENIINQYSQKTRELFALNAQIKSLETTKKNIETYNIKIESYFSKKS